MRAVVLVGGRGTRLRPLTDHVPKPMLPIGHRPMIARLVDRLAVAGVREVTLALGFRPEPFVEAFPDGRVGDVELRYAVEPEPLDTAGAIRFAADHSGIDDTFVVANGDIVTDLAVADLVAAHREFGAEATLHLTPVDDPSAFGVVEVDHGGRVDRFVEKPAPGETASNLINAGTYVFEPSVLSRIATGRKVSVEREVFPAVVADGGLFALATDDYWIDTGRPELYLDANIDLLAGGRPERCEPVALGAEVAGSALLDRSLVESGATVGARVRLTGSVVLSGAVIDEDAVVERSVVMGRIGRAAVVRDSVVGVDGVVADHAELHDARVPEPV
jgi:mannose-1-phosphate guanylyltransferase